MADVTVAIFTFTRNEETAVKELLNRVYIGLPRFGTTVWAPTWPVGEALESRLSNGRIARVEHHPLRAQGNVIAAAALSSSAWEKRADYYVFYGCCGAVDSTLVGHVFRAASVSYMSLGVVEKPAEPRTRAGWWWRAVSRRLGSPGAEVVKLKNKWIVPTTPSEQAPLDPIQLTAGSAGAAGSLSGLGLPDAHVVATDKVIKVSPGVAPVPIFTPPPTYTKEDWTYSQALALYTGVPTTRPVVIEMETFGIASTMQAMGLGDRVIVLRVVTDALSNKAAQTPQQQLNFLRAGSAELAAAIATILGI